MLIGKRHFEVSCLLSFIARLEEGECANFSDWMNGGFGCLEIVLNVMNYLLSAVRIFSDFFLYQLLKTFKGTVYTKLIILF